MIVDIYNTSEKYGLIYADPSWTYNDKASAGKRGCCYKYNVMTTKDIRSLPVGKIAADDCALFMWITMPMLRECFDVMESWGFTYKTMAFVWIKQNKVANTLFWGMGNWTRANAEMCLLGIKGKPKRASSAVHSVVISHIEEHSKKPDEVRRRIGLLMGNVPKIELFARQEYDGWDAWGDELPMELPFN